MKITAKITGFVLLILFFTGCDINARLQPLNTDDSTKGGLSDEPEPLGKTNVLVKVNINNGNKGDKKPTSGVQGTRIDQAVAKQDIASSKSSVADQKPTEAGAEEVSSEGEQTDSPVEERKPFKYVGMAEPEKDLLEAYRTNILFYLGSKGDGSCWNHLSYSIDDVGFFSHIDDLNWQSGVAFYSHDPELYQFRRDHNRYLVTGGNWTEWNGKPVYVLKKDLFSEDESDEYLKKTIRTEYVRNIIDHYETGRGAVKWAGEPQFPWPHKPRKVPEDPLFGLHKLLIESPYNLVRAKSKTVVVLLEFDNYRYTSEEWSDFIKQHKDIWFVALSSRRGMVANHAYGSKDLKWIPCGNSHIALQLADFIKRVGSATDDE